MNSWKCLTISLYKQIKLEYYSLLVYNKSIWINCVLMVDNLEYISRKLTIGGKDVEVM